jgi:hypothetical protein
VKGGPSSTSRWCRTSSSPQVACSPTHEEDGQRWSSFSGGD